MISILKYCYFLSIVAFIGIFYSCIDNNVANLDDTLIFTPEYSVPLGFGQFIMEDIISSPNFDTIPADTANWHDSLYFEYDGNYYYLPPDAVFDTVLQNEFDFSLIEDWLDNATYLMLRINIENTIPGEILMQVYFVDADDNIVFSLFDDPGIEIPGAIDNNSEKIQEDTYLVPEEIDNLRNVTRVISFIRLNINAHSEKASYQPNQFFKFQLGMRVGLEIDKNEQAF